MKIVRATKLLSRTVASDAPRGEKIMASIGGFCEHGVLLSAATVERCSEEELRDMAEQYHHLLFIEDDADPTEGCQPCAQRYLANCAMLGLNP